MERHETYGIVILIILALIMLGWLLHLFFDGDMIKEVAGYLVKLTNGLFPVIAHNLQRPPTSERQASSWPDEIGLPQQQTEATLSS